MTANRSIYATEEVSSVEFARLKAVEAVAKEIYKTALGSNGKATMGEWARLGDALEGK